MEKGVICILSHPQPRGQLEKTELQHLGLCQQTSSSLPISHPWRSVFPHPFGYRCTNICKQETKAPRCLSFHKPFVSTRLTLVTRYFYPCGDLKVAALYLAGATDHVNAELFPAPVDPLLVAAPNRCPMFVRPSSFISYGTEWMADNVKAKTNNSGCVDGESLHTPHQVLSCLFYLSSFVAEHDLSPTLPRFFLLYTHWHREAKGKGMKDAAPKNTSCPPSASTARNSIRNPEDGASTPLPSSPQSEPRHIPSHFPPPSGL
jgi:hypothetical protein